ncbi:hypothetical protein MGA3_08635 [Bacillus methanolicus MGA3]|nr:hypothetical protein MGA3_08635 [Bacillus methanolicus MGA3]
MIACNGILLPFERILFVLFYRLFLKKEEEK